MILTTQDFRNTRAWCYTCSFKDTKTKKRPAIKIGLSEDSYFTFEELLAQPATGHIGFHLTKYHPYVIIDIDHSLTIPTPLDQFPTYTETTLSQQGLRLVYKLDVQAYQYYKIDHPITYVKARKGSYWDGQISVTNNFMVMTGQTTNNIPIYEFNSKTFAFVLSAMSATKTATTTVSLEEIPTVPTSITPRRKARELEKLVMSLPIDQSYLIKQAYEKVTNAEYCHYDYWLLVGMAIYNECEDMPKGIALFNKWSAQDRDNYPGESDITKKFLSFHNEIDKKITIKTLKALQSHLLFNWKMVKNKIDTNAYYNIRLGLNTLKLQVYNAMSIGYFIKGPNEIVDQYTNAQKFLDFTGPFQSDTSFSIFLASIFQEICNWPGVSWEKNLFNLATSNATILYPVEEWLKAPSDEQDNSNSTFEELWACFKLQVGSNEQLCKNMLYRWLMQILKMADPAQRRGANEGFLLLTGPENSRKTSFFRQLFPPLMKPFILESMENISSDKERRDLVRSLYCRPLVYFDECDTLFKDSITGSTFKKFMTSIDQTFVDIYSKSATTGVRTAVLGGTTNIRNIRLEDTGSRRLWIMPIEYIDMERMSKISRYHLFKNLQKEYNIAVAKHETPWVMKQDEAIEISHANLEFGTTTNLEEILKEIFVWPETPHYYKMSQKELEQVTKSPQRPNHPHLYKQKLLINLIELNAPKGFKINMTSLKNELIALSKRFTGHKTPQDIGKYRYLEGKLYVPMSNGKNRTYWLLPELQSDIVNPFNEEEDNGQD